MSSGDISVDYVCIKTLGRGAFGQAVLYRKVDDNKLVVWKEVSLDKLSDKHRKDAHNEIEVLASLSHFNIVEYLNSFLDESTLCLELEYCDKGDLSHLIDVQYQKLINHDPTSGQRINSYFFTEPTVLWYTYQVLNAVSYIHAKGILHRDIKTLNIFLVSSQESDGEIVKLGDFGISKVLENNDDLADTYAGTLYYLSPEVMKGEKYARKSDCWACGCVLVELCTLNRCFDGTNALQLANAIINAERPEINVTRYSPEFIEVVDRLLTADPESRADASDLLSLPLFDEPRLKLDALSDRAAKAACGANNATQDSVLRPVVTVRDNRVFFWGCGKRSPGVVEKFDSNDPALTAIHVEMGPCHVACVTSTKDIYTWSIPSVDEEIAQNLGQLGHGNYSSYKQPKKVANLKVENVWCGNDFTLCLVINSENEQKLMSTGANHHGCLGIGKDDVESMNVFTEVQLDKSLAMSSGMITSFEEDPPETIDFTIKMVSAGVRHCIALVSHNNALYLMTWGSNQSGCLGVSEEGVQTRPVIVPSSAAFDLSEVCDVSAGNDCSFVTLADGRVFGCGSNQHNLLGMAQSRSGLKGHGENLNLDLEVTNFFKIVTPLKAFGLKKIVCGTNHNAGLTKSGKLVTWGCNSHGQLGHSSKSLVGPALVKGALIGHTITRVACGNCFTVVATADNHIFVWGRNDFGQLGLESSKNVYTPRPVLGSLAQIKGVSARAAGVIVIAEQITSQSAKSYTQTTARSISSASAERPSNEESINDSFMLNSMPPAWLQDELDDEEASSINDSQVTRLQKKVTKLQNQVDALTNENASLKQSNLELQTQLDRFKWG